MDADEKQFTVIYPRVMVDRERAVAILEETITTPLASKKTEAEKEGLAKRQANAAVALFKMGKFDQVWPVLKHTPDPRARSYLVHRLGPLMSKPDPVWPALKHTPDPAVRSDFIHRLGPRGADIRARVRQVADFRALVRRFDEESDVTIHRALLLSLGEFGEEGLSAEARQALLPKMQELYRTDADPGLHAAAEWLLRQWQQESWLKQVNGEWAKDKDQRQKRLQSIQQLIIKDPAKTPPQWYVNGQGQTMVVIPGPVEFDMGSPSTEEGRFPHEVQHKKRIGQTFALAAKSVTVKEFHRYLREKKLEGWFEEGGQTGPLMQKFSPDDNGPIIFVNWYTAAAYCNWLSEQEGVPAEQWCYETNAKQLSNETVCACAMLVLPHQLLGRLGAAASARDFLRDRQPQVMALKKNYLHLRGYRLPQEAEWEYACRAGAVTSRYYGEAEELLPGYGWYLKNAGERSWPVGSKKPNDLGLFDMHGNVYTWCQDSYKDYPTPKKDEASEDKEDVLSISSTTSRVLRGCSFLHPAGNVRSAFRYWYVPGHGYHYVGFRPARTLAP